ncbi:MAG: hypothetical protein JXQ27_08090 [Acidobacteria bacterium]|nr:hypothetical protein [Acidobacteriota bacterium]
MEIHRVFIVVSALIIVFVVAGFLLFRSYDVEFLDYVVIRTILEKIEPGLDPAQVQRRFDEYHRRLKSGEIPREKYREAVLAAASHIEKVEVLHTEDLQRIYGYFEEGR